MRIRHVAVCTSDPWGVEALVMKALGLAVVQRDAFNPMVQIRNGVFALQDTFLEITTPGAPTAPTQRFLDKRGDGGYMVCVQVDDLASALARAEALGVRIVMAFDRHQAGDQAISAAHLHPADTGGALFSFEQPDPADSWAWAGEAWRDYRRGEIVRDIVGVELASPDPDRLVERLGRLFDLKPDGHVLQLSGGQIIVTRAAEGETLDRLVAIHFEATDRTLAGTSQLIAGTRFRLV